jgi:signal peptidase II
LIFNASDPVSRNMAVAFSPDGGYAPFLHGAVVDMFYFPLWQGRFPDWLPIWGGEPFEFFRPVFNVADAAISVGVAMMVLVQRKPKEEEVVFPVSGNSEPDDQTHPVTNAS